MKLNTNYKPLLFVIVVFTSFAAKSQNLTIPDANFKNALLNTACADYSGNGTFGSADLNNDDEIQLSEVIGIQGLRIVNQNVVTIESIENFVDLTYLDISFNSIETMNISALSNLKTLLCYGNELTTLNVSNNLDLEDLYCNENSITELDVSLNTNLVHLEIYINNISEIDVTLNPNLETFYCGNNPISELDVTHNALLKGLLMSDTQITEIDLSNNVLLEDFSAASNSMPFIDLSQNPELIFLGLDGNLISDIDVSNNPDLFELRIQNNNLISANIKNGTSFMMYTGFSGNPNLEFICADDFEITDVQMELDLLGYTETVVSDNCDLSVDDYSLASEVTIFPVPFKDELFLQSTNDIQYITMFNSSGQKILEATPKTLETTMDTRKLSSGLYIIKIETLNGVEFKNIIKQ